MDRRDLLPDSALENLPTVIAAVDAAESAEIAWSDRVRLHFLRNFTIEPIEPFLKFHLLRENIGLGISYGGYDTMLQEVLDPESTLNVERPDVIVVSLMLDILDAGSEAKDWRADEARSRIEELIQALLQRTLSLIVVNSLMPPIEALNDDRDEAWMAQLDSLNTAIEELVQRHPGRIAMTAWPQFMREAGVEASVDRRFWNLSQAPFKPAFLGLLAKDLAGLICAYRGRAKKCLILDCDNTLWGGVVGEDGIDEIRLDPNEATGAAFYELQASVVKLAERGIAVCICSKNNEADVFEVLETHPHCLLKRDHLVTWRIDWDNKAQHIADIARELNIGIDSLVFVDDSPQECELVRQLLPDVTVIQVPDDLAAVPDLLTKDGLFDAMSRSDEDRSRTKMYQDDAKRRDVKNQFDDLTAYLKSLGTVARIKCVGPKEIPRVAQLTQKTNQFNLTTRRYSEADIERFVEDDETAVYAMSAGDRYGDIGIIGVMIVERKGSTAIIDTLLMSCRALSRQLEFAFIDQCMSSLEESWGLDAWDAKYVPTRKNALVSDFWDRVGFRPNAEEAQIKRYTATVNSRPDKYRKVVTVHME